MEFIYIVMKENYIVGVFRKEYDATAQVNIIAEQTYGVNPATDPTDFEGALMRYGWADLVWWQKEVLYD